MDMLMLSDNLQTTSRPTSNIVSIFLNEKQFWTSDVSCMHISIELIMDKFRRVKVECLSIQESDANEHHKW